MGGLFCILMTLPFLRRGRDVWSAGGNAHSFCDPAILPLRHFDLLNGGYLYRHARLTGSMGPSRVGKTQKGMADMLRTKAICDRREEI